jgi:hypothetical protein
MNVATFKCESPRRQAMLSLWKKYVNSHGDWKFDTSMEVARVPVLVWPMPTQNGCFIVEHQDGHCQKVQPYELTFLGSKELFDQYDWSTDEA